MSLAHSEEERASASAQEATRAPQRPEPAVVALRSRPRRTAADELRTGTGIRDDAAIARYVRRAVTFLRDNPDAALHRFARFLGAAANAELNRLGVPSVRVEIRGGHGAYFDAATWSMCIASDARDKLLGELTEDEAAIIAMTVWHEARHAEQRFRVARMQAGEGAERGFAMEADAAAAASAAPLETPAGEMAEAREWRETGTDVSYRGLVTAWQRDVKAGAGLAREVTAADGPAPEEVRERIGRMLAGWSEPGGAMDVIRSQLPRAQRRRRATIIADIEAMIARFDAAEAEWRAIGPSPSRWDFVDLAEALRELVRAIETADRNQPVEKDAHAVGHKTFDAFHAELAAHKTPEDAGSRGDGP